MTPPDGRRPVVWFIDTASLLSMAIDPQIEAVVLDEVAATGGKVVIIDVVKEELEYRATQPDTADLAAAALASLGPDWPWLSTEWVDADAVEAIQIDVADGHPLRDPYEHWAESLIVLLCQQAQARGSALDVRFLTEDFNARRVANNEASMTPLSLHRLFHNRVHRDAMPAGDAARLSALIEKADRGRDMTEDDFLGPARRLGRPGWP